MMKKTIKVVGAIIENSQCEILCALRSPSMNLPNSWEFPGGKIEVGETIGMAIEREILEELGCKVSFQEIFCDITHDYGTFCVNLITVKCDLVSGTPTPKEHSSLIWLKRDNLSSLCWAPADVPTVEKLLKEITQKV